MVELITVVVVVVVECACLQYFFFLHYYHHAEYTILLSILYIDNAVMIDVSSPRVNLSVSGILRSKCLKK